MNETIETRCGECGVAVGKFPHSFGCSQQTKDDWERCARAYHKCWRAAETRSTSQWSRMREQTTFWQGKFHAVKTENNALRRKLYRKEAK